MCYAGKTRAVGIIRTVCTKCVRSKWALRESRVEHTASMTRIYKVDTIIATCVITYDWSHPIRVGVAKGHVEISVWYVTLRG